MSVLASLRLAAQHVDYRPVVVLDVQSLHGEAHWAASLSMNSTVM